MDCYEKLYAVKCALIDEIYNAVVEESADVNAHELGEVIDMIKDIQTIEYYKSVTINKNDTLTDSIRSL